ncbi:MAG: molybdopterin biosynthesis protein [Alkaliphilus sp.]|nr:molybdopterin biosynthesis protein [Alkaliphilus sp.]
MKQNKRNVYLSNIEVEKALQSISDQLKNNFDKPNLESIKVIEALERVTATPVFARYSSPNFNASAMDGIAVKAIATFGASEGNPLLLHRNKDFIYVDTGDPIHEPYDSVIMIEDVVELDENTVEIIKAASPWQHIRPIGEDIVANELIIPSNHKIRPVDMGALLSAGITDIWVYRKPKVGIIPTGTEIIEPGEPMQMGSIIESNSRVFEAMVKELGGEPRRYKTVPDDYKMLKDNIEKAIDENDLVIVNAGSSAGLEDYTASLVSELGRVLVHGIAAKPGKPTILGIVKDKPIIGIPGYPVSAYFVFETFAKPLIKKFQGLRDEERRLVEAVVSKRIISSLQHREYIRMKIGRVDGKLIATPLNRGAGVTMSLVRADGVLVVPQNSEGIEAGETVQVELLKELTEINNTIVSIGSHDLLMDLVGNFMHNLGSKYFLSSAHVGSMGGIMAIKRGEAHIAPIHLLDEDSGLYNIAYIKKYLSNIDMAIIRGVSRIQGFIVQKGNPKQIKSFEDLLKKGILFVNRQRGAGTRMLVDYQLKLKNIDPDHVAGYHREMTTHMAVAAAVLSGSADVGVGVYSAAKAMELDFVPIGEEAYDFAIPSKYLETDMIQSFVKVLKSSEFKTSLEEMGGYRLENVGEVEMVGS